MVELASNTADGEASDEAPAIILPLTVALVNVPTLVKLEAVTVDFNVVPVNVPASAIEEEEGVVQPKVPLPVVVKTWPLLP